MVEFAVNRPVTGNQFSPGHSFDVTATYLAQGDESLLFRIAPRGTLSLDPSKLGLDLLDSLTYRSEIEGYAGKKYPL